MTAPTPASVSASDATSRDGGGLLRLDGWPGWILLCSFIVVNLVIAMLAGGPAMRDGRGLLALTVLAVAGALALMSGSQRLELWRVFAILALIAACTLLMLEQLLIAGPSGFLSWNYNATNFILFAVAVKGRIRWAWIGLAIACGITLTWSLIMTHSGVQAFYLLYGEVGSLLAGTFFAVVLRNAAHRVTTLQAVRRHLIGEEHVRAETERERATQLALVRQRVTPALTLIANGQVSATQRGEHRLLEAVLRDEIRGARLAVEPLVSAVRAARGRGIDVVLLDDAEDGSLDWADLEWTADVVANLDGDRITIRLSGDPILITVATLDGDVMLREVVRL